MYSVKFWLHRKNKSWAARVGSGGPEGRRRPTKRGLYGWKRCCCLFFRICRDPEKWMGRISL